MLIQGHEAFVLELLELYERSAQNLKIKMLIIDVSMLLTTCNVMHTWDFNM